VVKFKRYESLDASTKKQIETLQKTCLPEDDPTFPEDGTWWVGYDGQQAVAFCLIKPSSQWEDTAYLARSGVLYYWRGKGLQKRMIGIREKHARSRGYTWLISDTTKNPPSANSLARLGYQMFEPTKPWGLDCTLYWRKKL
jgi:GNAT superfamily N-acetyltransferase